MLGVGFSEIVIIAIVCFVAFGPKELPALMRKLAIYYRQFMNLKEELRFQILSVDNEPQDSNKPPSSPEEVKHG